MTTIQINGGTLHANKKLVNFPDPQTREEYDIMKLRRILHECAHDNEPLFTEQMDKVDAIVGVLPADRDSADIIKAARAAGFKRAQMANTDGTNDSIKGSLMDAGYGSGMF